MRQVFILLITLGIIPSILLFADPDTATAQNWPQWRGPHSTGAAPAGNPPVEWSEQQNIKWKTPLPGIGYSTPVVWNDIMYLTAAIPPEGSEAPAATQQRPQSSGAQQQGARQQGARAQGGARGQGQRAGRSGGSARRGGGGNATPTGPVKFLVMAIDRSTGKILWEKQAREEAPHEGKHRSTTWATGSPITDGEHIWAFFGSRGLFCYDLAGNLQWEKDFGDMQIRNAFGEGTTPRLYKNRLVVNWDHEGQSYIVVLGAKTGNEIWKKDRDERTTWMTPLVVEVAGKPQAITAGKNKIIAYDLENGVIIWEAEGLTDNAIPSPMEADGVVYLTSGYRGNAMRAIRLSEAKGKVTGPPALLWSYDQDTPYVPSPLLLNGLMYFLKGNNGILTCLDVATGQPLYSNQRLEGISSMYASPTGVEDRVYLLSRDGVTMVVKHGSEFNVLATNTLDDNFDASPVIIGNEIYLRGHESLYCITR
jgi:outer membrane protein assembly factor BamB